MEYKRKLTQEEKRLLEEDPDKFIMTKNNEILDEMLKHQNYEKRKDFLYNAQLFLHEDEIYIKIVDISNPELKKEFHVENIGYSETKNRQTILAYLPGKTSKDIRLERKGNDLNIYTDGYKDSVKIEAGLIDVKKKDVGEGLVEIVLS